MMGESELIDEIEELVEGSDRAVSVLCRASARPGLPMAVTTHSVGPEGP